MEDLFYCRRFHYRFVLTRLFTGMMSFQRYKRQTNLLLINLR